MKFRIKYGTDEKQLDITDTCLKKCVLENDFIFIPRDDNARARLFTDPIFGIVKKIFIYHLEDGNTEKPSVICHWNQDILIDIKEELVFVEKIPPHLKYLFPRERAMERLKKIQERIQLLYGNFDIEIPEQLMSVRFLTGHEKVLEIGGNIGRNSMIIASILKEKGNQNMVVLESDAETAKKLDDNRNLNDFSFFVEPSALSKRKLIQGGTIGWDTFESDELLEGFKPVNSITWEELNEKYQIEFDTLVLDCEGAFYLILKDMPEVLDRITKIFIENDFKDITHKKYVDNVLKECGFEVKYTEELGPGYRPFACEKEFFQFWERSL